MKHAPLSPPLQPRVLFAYGTDQRLRHLFRPYAEQGNEAACHAFGKHFPESNLTVIYHVTNIGPQARCTPSEVWTDASYSTHELAVAKLLWPTVAFDVVGSPHSHPMNLHELSNTDLHALQEVTTTHQRYLAILLSGEKFRLQAWQATRDDEGQCHIRTADVVHDAPFAKRVERALTGATAKAHRRVRERLTQLLRLVHRPGYSCGVLKILGRYVGSMYHPDGPCYALIPGKRGTAQFWRADVPGAAWARISEEQLTQPIQVNSETVDLGVLVEEGWSVYGPTSLLAGSMPERVGLRVRRNERWVSVLPDAHLADVVITPTSPVRLIRQDAGVYLKTPRANLPVTLWEPDASRERLQTVQAATQLDGKRVVIAGIGSLGYRLALHAAACGVHALAFDHDSYSVTNAYPRYPLTTPVEELVGRSKALILAEMGAKVLRTDRISGVHADLKGEARRVAAMIQDFRPDLIVVTTDTADSRQEINWIARQLHIPQLHGALSDGAGSLEVIYYSATAGAPCASCRQLVAHSHGTVLRRSERYGDEQHAVPALHANIELGAAALTRIALALLASPDKDDVAKTWLHGGNVFWLGHEPGRWLFKHPFQTMAATLDPMPECGVCATASSGSRLAI